MALGEPSFEQALSEMREWGAQSIVHLPLFPQEAGATTGSMMDAMASAMSKAGSFVDREIQFKTVKSFSHQDFYVGAVAESVRQVLSHFKADGILVSFHSLPLKQIEKARAERSQEKAYDVQCLESFEMIRERVGTSVPWSMGFQSRLGRARWLEPSTHSLLESLPAQGVKKLLTLCPGFLADNLETLEEIGMRGRKTFLDAGGTEFKMVPCLNDHPLFIRLVAAFIKTLAHGFVDDPVELGHDDLDRGCNRD